PRNPPSRPSTTSPCERPRRELTEPLVAWAGMLDVPAKSSQGRGGDGIEPCDAGEPGEIRIGGDNGEAVFEGERGQMRVRHEVPGRAAFPDDPAEHLLMPRSRHGDPGGWPGQPVLDTLPRLRCRGGR